MRARDPLAALAVVAGYMLARHFIYRAMPSVDFHAWFERDLWMSVPRLAAFGACVWLIRRDGGGREAWGWHGRLPELGALPLLLAAAMELCGHLSRGTRTSMGADMMAWGWLATGAVALFEEAAFRSLLYHSLRERFLPLRAAALSALAFTLFHYEAQPLAIAWPHLLVFGLAACAAVELGAGLYWLVAMHWFVDGAWYHLTDPPGSAAGRLFPPLLAATAAASLWLLSRAASRRTAAAR